MNISIIIGTRPNFIKVTQFKKHAVKYGHNIKIIHTGQHYDKNMSTVFFDQFGLVPDRFFELKSKNQMQQVGEIMANLEQEFTENRPDLVLVPGDVNSTFAGAFVANRMGIKIGHIESGLRSFDREMPEEINRILTDEITDVYFITEPSGIENLTKEGKDPKKIQYVGNTMIDTLVAFEEKIEACPVLEDFNLVENDFFLVTIHRPSNVDNVEGLRKVNHILNHISKSRKVIFPIHPRTKKMMLEYDLFSDLEASENIIFSDPMDYFQFQKLIKSCKAIVTDSGGIQEEATFRQKPCITLRNNTERPITTQIGSNVLCKLSIDDVSAHIDQIEAGNWKKGEIPKYWDGAATQRIFEAINQFFA